MKLFRLLFTGIFCSLLLSGALSAQTVTVKKLSNVKKVIGTMVQYRGTLYSIYNGALYAINLSNGEYKQVGTSLFNNIKFFFALNNRLFVIEKDGSMTQIDPVSGTWSVVSIMGSWNETERVITVGNNFYGIQNGVMYHYPTLNEKVRKQVGEAEFFDMGMVMYTDTTLHSIIGGQLYQVNTTTGKWKKIGSGKNYRNCRMGAVSGNILYTFETPDALFQTSLPDGTKKQLDNTQFTTVRGLFADSGHLYCFSSEYDLCEIIVGPAAQ